MELTFAHFPKFYHCDRFGSDKQWIKEKFKYIPPDQHEEISKKYDNLYLGAGRKAANTYLHGIAKEYFLQSQGDRERASEKSH